jgi:hypothetical protein
MEHRSRALRRHNLQILKPYRAGNQTNDLV